MMLARQWKERGTSRPISDSAHAPCVLRESYPLFNDFRYHKLRSVINSLSVSASQIRSLMLYPAELRAPTPARAQ
jgi:hypothetical protein